LFLKLFLVGWGYKKALPFQTSERVIKKMRKVINFSKTPPKKAFPVQTSEGVIKKYWSEG